MSVLRLTAARLGGRNRIAAAACTVALLAGGGTGVAQAATNHQPTSSTPVSAQVLGRQSQMHPAIMKTASMHPNSAGGGWYGGYLAGGASARLCWSFDNRSYEGPPAVIATSTSNDIILTTVATDLENRSNYGWVYCTTTHNSSSRGTGYNLDVRVQL